ncbi:uncharacterized [Tachysurus ichikawai]
MAQQLHSIKDDFHLSAIAEQQNKASDDQKRSRTKRRMSFIDGTYSGRNPSQRGCCGCCQGSKTAIKITWFLYKINYCSTLRYSLKSGKWLNIIRRSQNKNNNQACFSSPDKYPIDITLRCGGHPVASRCRCSDVLLQDSRSVQQAVRPSLFINEEMMLQPQPHIDSLIKSQNDNLG